MTAIDASQPSLISKLQSRPYLGIVALIVALMGQWFRHSIFPFTEMIFGEAMYWALCGVGFIGVALIWSGIDEPEIPATWKGYLGGLFIWVGWFETGFHVFADVFAVPVYTAAPYLKSPPDLNLIMASFTAFIPMFILYGLFNRETKCNLMRWVHRNARLNPGKPTPDAGRNFARITALETIFIIWFCYALWLFITYFGISMSIIGGAYALWVAWFAYIFWKLTKISRPAYALRYGIAVGVIGFIIVAMPSHMRMFPPIWLELTEFPISNILALLVFVGGMMVFIRDPRKGAAEA